VDWRLLVAGLILDGGAPYPFLGLLWGLAVQQNSIMLFNFSIACMTVFLVGGLALAGIGFVRRGIVNDWQAGVLFLGSFALGVLSLTLGLSTGVWYGDDLAACGGSPPGVLWSPNDTVLTRCDIFYRVQSFSMLQWVWVIPLVAGGLVFSSSFIAARRISLDRSTTASQAQH